MTNTSSFDYLQSTSPFFKPMKDDLSTPPKVHTIEPIQRDGFTILNPNVMTSQYSRCFKKTADGTYSAQDPRLFDSARAIWMTLDRPPVDGAVPQCDIYCKSLNQYHRKYDTYKDISFGQLMYYSDKSIQDPYFEPVYDNKAAIDKMKYVTPMTNVWNQFDRTPLVSRQNFNCLPRVTEDAVKDAKVAESKLYSAPCLTEIADLSESREDIMSKQMRQINRQRWFPI